MLRLRDHPFEDVFEIPPDEPELADLGADDGEPDPEHREPLRLGEWLDEARPNMRWDYRHMRFMQEKLDQVTDGTIMRLLLNIAGRHSKTEHVSSFIAMTLDQAPKTRAILATYSQNQAHKLSIAIRRLCVSRNVRFAVDRDTMSEWETAAGGGLRAVGAGTGLASVNADLIVIDDPIGTRAEAESQAVRDGVWDWITSDILARCEPQTRVVFSMPRWHTDDPAGRVRDRQASRWTIVDLPGRAEPNDPLGRKEGEPLWPELRGEEWLDQMRAEIGEYAFASFIQCRPRPREGGMFKWSWWQLLEAIPAQGPMVRYWDLAGTEPRGKNHDPDYSAGALLCRMVDKRTAIVDVARFRKSIAARDAELEAIAKADLAAYRGRIRWWLETEAGIAGADRTAELVRRLQAIGMVVHTEHPTGSKPLRAEPLAGAVEVGNAVLCPGAWRDQFRAEAADFPNGKHDDQIDAAAGAFTKLSIPVGTWGRSQFTFGTA